MRLRFGATDYHAYVDTRSALLDELEAWLARDEPDRGEVVADVKRFLDWRYGESGVLDDFTLHDVSEFLLEWCAHRLRGQPDAAINQCFAVGVYLDFMATTGRLVGGSARAARLRRLTDDLVPTVLAEVRDPMTAAPEPQKLPFLYIPPSATEVAEDAEASLLNSKIDALRGYFGSEGKLLTDNGHLQLVDGRALVELLKTSDVLDLNLGDRTISVKSTAPMRRLNFILDVAIEAEAVQVRDHRVIAAQAWEVCTPVERAQALFAAIRARRPLQSLSTDLGGEGNEVAKLIDDGIVHWLVPLLVAGGEEVPFETLLEIPQSVVDRQLDLDEDGVLEEATAEGIGHLLEVLADAGVVRWTDRTELSQLLGPSSWTGGSVALTAIGRHILPDYLDEGGYVLRRLDRIADWDAAALIDVMSLLDNKFDQVLIANWRSDRPAAERVQMLTEEAVRASSAATRLAAFSALDSFDSEVAEPFVRQLLDSPVSGHAALWLISRQRADAATLGSFIDTAVLVDALASKVNEPAVLYSFFTGPEPTDLIESLWRHPAPETAVVLDALGRNLPDPALAKAARKAAVKHRSWMANRTD